MTVMVFLYSTFVIYFCDVLSSRARARASIRSEERDARRGGRRGRMTERGGIRNTCGRTFARRERE